MSTYLLTYIGPANFARVEIVELLKRFPKAFFVEKGKNEFEVSADYAFAQEITQFSHWRAQSIRIAA
ncbi:MAG: hypothetical protein ABSF50_13160 [Burkholderiaceae bacterium]|jgi:hypothetical protein